MEPNSSHGTGWYNKLSFEVQIGIRKNSPCWRVLLPWAGGLHPKGFVGFSWTRPQLPWDDAGDGPAPQKIGLETLRVPSHQHCYPWPVTSSDLKAEWKVSIPSKAQLLYLGVRQECAGWGCMRRKHSLGLRRRRKGKHSSWDNCIGCKSLCLNSCVRTQDDEYL